MRRSVFADRRPGFVAGRRLAERLSCGRMRASAKRAHLVASAVAMVCIALALFMAEGCTGPATPARFPAAGGSCSAQPPGCGTAQGAAPNLAESTWSAAAAPPLSSRLSQASVWTGTELLIWGGLQMGQEFTPADDGAAYDPATGSWTPMPASPLSPRDGTFAVWTGHQALFWGGGNGSPTPLMDGASYDPASRTWTPMPASPLQADADGRLTVVWTGAQMVVIEPEGSAAFDPATNAWTSVPTLPTVAGWQPYAVRAEWTGGAVVTWVAARPPAVNGSEPGGYHFSAYWWTPGSNSWTPVPEAPDNGSFPFGTAASVNGRLLFLGGYACPPGVSCPAGYYGAAWFEPVSGTWSSLPDGFSGGAGPAVWTGSAMVVFATRAGADTGPPSTQPVRPRDRIQTGMAAAFAPATGTWTNLAPCPLTDLTSATLAWTGQQLIVVAMNGDTGAAPQTQVLSRAVG